RTLSLPDLAILLYHHYRHHRPLHSFPTRRSSDLNVGGGIRFFGGRRAGFRTDIHRTHFSDNGVDINFWEITARSGRSVGADGLEDRKSTRLNSSHVAISYAVFCLKKKKRSSVSSI